MTALRNIFCVPRISIAKFFLLFFVDFVVVVFFSVASIVVAVRVAVGVVIFVVGIFVVYCYLSFY